MANHLIRLTVKNKIINKPATVSRTKVVQQPFRNLFSIKWPHHKISKILLQISIQFIKDSATKYKSDRINRIVKGLVVSLEVQNYDSSVDESFF